MKRHWLTCCLVLLLTVLAVALAIFLLADTKFNAERRVHRFLSGEKNASTDYLNACWFDASRLGHSAWRVAYGDPTTQPIMPQWCLVDREKRVHHLNSDSLSKIMREEFRPHLMDPGHEDFIRQFLRILHRDRFTPLRSLAEIPGYSRHPLPDAKAEEIKPPQKTPEGTHVFFTYQQIGGYVRRYEFYYNKDGAFLNTTASELDHNIGDAIFYE